MYYSKVSLILILYKKDDKSGMPKLWNTPTTVRACQSSILGKHSCAY